MKHQPSQFEESLEQLLQATPIPERADHTAELRARVLNDYRERQVRYAEPKLSFMNTVFPRLFLATSGAVSVLAIGFVIFNQPVVQTQVAKLRGNSNVNTPTHSLLSQLSPKEVLADSLAATIGELNDTSQSHYVHMKTTSKSTDGTIDSTIDFQSWKEGLNVRVKTTDTDHVNNTTGMTTQLTSYEADETSWNCVADTTGTVSGPGYDNNSGVCFHYGAPQEYNRQVYTSAPSLSLESVSATAARAGDTVGPTQRITVTFRTTQPLSNEALIESVNSDIADLGDVVSGGNFFNHSDGLLPTEYNAKKVGDQYEYRVVMDQAYDMRGDAPTGSQTSKDTRRNYIQILDGNAHSPVYQVNIDTGDITELTTVQLQQLVSAQQQAKREKAQQQAGQVTLASGYDPYADLQNIYTTMEKNGQIIDSAEVQGDDTTLLKVHYRYTEIYGPQIPQEEVDRRLKESPYTEVNIFVDLKTKEVVRVEYVLLPWTQNTYTTEIIESASVGPEESGQLLGPDPFTIDTWKNETRDLYSELYPDRGEIQFTMKDIGEY